MVSNRWQRSKIISDALMKRDVAVRVRGKLEPLKNILVFFILFRCLGLGLKPQMSRSCLNPDTYLS